MTDSEKVDAYIEKHSSWEKQLRELREIFAKTRLKEEIKWGAPTYTLNGKLVAGLAAFKNHLGIWFHQGVFLKDEHKKLHNAQEGKTKALRQWRFERGDAIDSKLVLEYINEAIENSLAGKESKPQPKKDVPNPAFFEAALEKNPKLRACFDALSPGKKREYAEHLAEAKREATQQNRLEKCTALILEGRGLYDAYKKTKPL